MSKLIPYLELVKRRHAAEWLRQGERRQAPAQHVTPARAKFQTEIAAVAEQMKRLSNPRSQPVKE